MNGKLVGAICAVLLAAPCLTAHHGISGYDRQSAMTITGVMTAVEWVNPHVLIYIDVKGEQGSVTNWALEGLSPDAESHINGLTKETLKPGMQITVIGFPPTRDPARVASALSYSASAGDRLKSGHVLQVGELRMADNQVRRFGMGPDFNYPYRR